MKRITYNLSPVNLKHIWWVDDRGAYFTNDDRTGIYYRKNKPNAMKETIASPEEFSLQGLSEEACKRKIREFMNERGLV